MAPRAPKKCGDRDCEERVTSRIYCDEHTKDTRGTWGRGSTRQSRRTRAAVLTAWPTCYLQYDGCTEISTDDDHVIPLSQGGADDWTNHAGACHHCHQIKTQTEAAAGRGITPKG